MLASAGLQLGGYAVDTRLRMQTRILNDYRIAIGALLAVPLILAIALPLYFSGSPKLRARTAAPSATIPAPESGAGMVAQQTPQSATPAVTTTNQPETQRIEAAIDGLLAGRDGVYGVVAADPASGTRYSRNADVPFLAASLYKLVLLADVHAAIEDGLIAADTELALLPEYFPGPDEPDDSYFDASFVDGTIPISEALYATGAYSSNVAAYALLALTDDAQLEAMARRLGMTHTFFHVQPTELEDWPPATPTDADPAALSEAITFAEEQAGAGPLMLTTPRDIETYFSRLLAGNVVSPAVSATILETLKEQAVDDRFPCLLPPGVEMAHKTGNLDHVVHDVGIIWRPEGPVLLIAMVQDPPDDAEATLVIQRLAAIAYGLDQFPSIADAFATPEISCGIVAPFDSETSEPLATEEVDF